MSFNDPAPGLPLSDAADGSFLIGNERGGTGMIEGRNGGI